MKQERSFEILFIRDSVNDKAALAVIMKTIDIVREEKPKGVIKDEYCKTERKAC
jgi:hypothetical protein